MPPKGTVTRTRSPTAPARCLCACSSSGCRPQLWQLDQFIGRFPLDQIDRSRCQAFKGFKLQEARELRDALAAGADIRDRSGRPAKPLGPGSIARLIAVLTAVLDEAIEDGHIASNPARGRRMKVHVPKPRGSFLEVDQLTALLAAASEQDGLLNVPVDGGAGETARAVAGLLARGLRPAQIAERLGLSRSTVTFHAQRLGARVVGRGYAGRRVVCEILGRTGVRASELCAMRIGHVRLHDPDGARFRIPDSKTETSIREVQMTPALVEAVVDHLDRLQRAGHPTGPEDFLVQSRTGTRISRERVGAIVKQAAERATEHRSAEGLPPMPSVSPHSLRRTYISIARRANQFRVVMSRVAGRAHGPLDGQGRLRAAGAGRGSIAWRETIDCCGLWSADRRWLGGPRCSAALRVDPRPIDKRAWRIVSRLAMFSRMQLV